MSILDNQREKLKNLGSIMIFSCLLNDKFLKNLRSLFKIYL